MKTIHVRIEFVREGLDPLSQFFRNEIFQDLFKCITSTSILVACGFINERNNADTRKSAYQYFALLCDMLLLR